jgi:dolichol-phosphate mannosyltransferase
MKAVDFFMQARTNDQKKKKWCLIIPTFNEKDNIAQLISRIQSIKDQLALELNLLIVDDASTDGTLEVLKDLMQEQRWIQLIERPALLGIGSAYVDGFSFALSQEIYDYFGEMDADLQHPPETLIPMSREADSGVDVVVASRYIAGGGSKNWALSRRIISKGANFLTKLCVKAPISDCTSGFRLISKRAVEGLLQTQISTKGYAFQIESLYVYRKLGMSFSEVAYYFEERKAGETKLRWKEMVRFAGTALRLGIFGLKVKR